jgi:D-alanyl-D-alanine carboxypeptidase/D-alanyl-D-alanine-endopeptidase (penicillin-binding protein 4)
VNRAGRPIFRRGRTHLLALAAVLAAASPAGAAPRTLEGRLAHALRVPHVSPRRSAALAVDLTTGRRVFAQNPALPLVPASNEKLAVTFTVLTRLGPDFRIQTHAEADGTQDGTVVHGRLFLVGAGDPTLSTGSLATLAQQVRAAGIRRVTGGVFGDESAFDTQRTAPGWKPSFFLDESPPLSALVVDRSQYRGRTNRWPALAAAILFRNALRAAGVQVPDRIGVAVAPVTAQDVAYVESAPLWQLVRDMDQQSDNFTAEMLLKLVSLIDVDHGSTAAGARLVTRTLRDAGVPMAGVRIVDGSGLSSFDRITVGALVAELKTMYDDVTLRSIVTRALPVSGRSGTLKDRMRDIRGRVRAKTGTTDIASALSGFAGSRYVFSVVQNGSPVSYFWARVAQDRFARALAVRG